MRTPDWTLGVLFGGVSRRMGQDKSRLKVGRTTLLEYVISRCRKPNQPAILGIGQRGRFVPETLAQLPQVIDRIESAGPLAGIEALIVATTTPWLIVVPCDMPGLKAETLDELIPDGDEEFDFCAFKTPERVQILPMALRSAWAKKELPRLLDSGSRRILDLMKLGQGHHKPWQNSEDGQSVFHNINTQSDFESFVNSNDQL